MRDKVNKLEEQGRKYTIKHLKGVLIQHLTTQKVGEGDMEGSGDRQFTVKIMVSNKISVNNSKKPLVYFKNCPLFYSFKVIYTEEVDSGGEEQEEGNFLFQDVSKE